MSKIPSIAMIPSGYKASKLYSVLPTDGTGDFTTTRASIATRVNENGLIEEVASNVPRLDYSDGGCPSLLLEPQRTNLNTFSDPTDAQKDSTSYNLVTYQDNYSWGLGDVINNAIVFGDNSTTRYAYYNSTVVSGTEYTLSVIVKMDDNSVPIPSTDFLFILGGSSAPFVNGYNIEDYGNNIYRVSASATADVSSTANGILKVASNSTKGFKISAFQIEQGSYATSFIKSVGTTQTRTADTATGSGSSTVINSSEGVLYFEGSALANDGTNRTITINDGSITNYILIRLDSISNRITAFNYVGGVLQCDLGFTVANAIDIHKIAFKWKVNDFALWVDGVEVAIDSAGATYDANTLNQLSFDITAGILPFYGKTKDLRVYTTALSDLELTNLTKI